MRLSVAAVCLSLCLIGVSSADDARASTRKETNIPAGGLGPALIALAKDRHFQIVYVTEEIANVRTEGAVGEFTTEEALKRLLAGTGLTYRYLDDKTVTIGSAVIPQGRGGRASEAVSSGSSDDANTNREGKKSSSGAQGRSSRSLPVESQASNSNNPATSLEEIIVTATKRRENLQDVPFGISALSTKDLERSGAQSEQDYLAEVPGVHYSDAGRGRSLLVIRGISTEGTTGNLQSTVEIYLDEFPLTDRFSSWTTPDISTFDIERVEVLRGPQGTLFGSGALGGAVRIITSQPDATAFHAKIEVGGATTDGGASTDSFKAMVNMPIIDDQLALRVVGFRTHDGGWIDNVTRKQGDVNGGYNEGGRAILQYTPTDALKLRATVLNERDSLDDSGKTFSSSSEGPANRWDGIIPESSISKLSIYNFTGEYDAGFATLTSISTYEQRKSYLATDFIRSYTTTPDPNNDHFYITHDSTKSSQEVRLSSNGQTNLEWTIGGFFLHTHQDLLQIFRLGDFDLETLLIPTTTSEGAAFGEATYHITRKVSVTAGARWFDNSFDQATEYGPTSFYQGAHGLVTIHSSATTPKFSASYYPKENVHLYVTASKGYRVGQVNFNAGINPIVPPGFATDSLWNYEVGIKANWFDNRLQTNVSAYHIDWTNIQLGRLVGGWYFTDNAGKAKSSGVEAAFVARPIQAINLGSAITYTDAVLTSVLPGTGLMPDSILPGSPRWSASNYAQATTQFKDDVSGYIRLSHQFVSKVYGYIVNSPTVASDPYHKFDLRAGVIHGPYEVVAYVDNLTNNDAAVSRTSTPPYDYAFRLRPRTVGLTLRASF
jgi:iron complex outermembrane receptor protein